MAKIEKIRKATRHTKKATKLLKMANELYLAQKDGLIEEDMARNAIIKLNQQALEEAEKASQLRKEFIEEKEKEKGR